MARSEEAILRRALKRNRTEGQQRYSDRIDMNRQTLKQKQIDNCEFDSNTRLRVSKPSIQNRKEDRRKPSSRNVDSADNSNQFKNGSHGRRITDSSEMPRRKPSLLTKTNKTKHHRHNVETSKKLVWARQSDSKIISKNEELRQRYRETGGKGMSAEDLERAKLLLARDERKQEKKKKKNQRADATDSNTKASKESSDTGQKDDTSSSRNGEVLAQEETTLQHRSLESKKGKKSNEAQAKRDQNRALRMLYLKTCGKGMKEDQIKRAKLLIARDEKKQKRRAKTK